MDFPEWPAVGYRGYTYQGQKYTVTGRPLHKFNRDDEGEPDWGDSHTEGGGDNEGEPGQGKGDSKGSGDDEGEPGKGKGDSKGGGDDEGKPDKPGKGQGDSKGGGDDEGKPGKGKGDSKSEGGAGAHSPSGQDDEGEPGKGKSKKPGKGKGDSKGQGDGMPEPLRTRVVTSWRNTRACRCVKVGACFAKPNEPINNPRSSTVATHT